MDLTKSAHRNLHSEHGALRGEHPGRSRNRVIKVVDLAWLQFEKPDLTRADAFARAFGFQTARHRPDELHLRGSQAGGPCAILRRGPRTRFTGVAFRAGDEADVLRLADKSGAPARPLAENIGGVSVDLIDPSGMPVRVVAGMHELPELPGQQPHVFNFGH
ncbi:MAG TPA: 2,3-dihydroxybiphenyl 1,2-dioxygenase, partial [Mycobacterium sp.]|nr:2,3-dihydroxybiphenyl 1,2-dioxygenase [Mycobacterium sp.]